MESASSSAPDEPKRGLPPVAPPSGRFIAQLFLVPGAIVLLAVLLLMMFHNLFGGGQTAAQFVRQLDSANPDIRWRAASDLAQTLSRPDSLALRSDVDFAWKLVKQLDDAVAELDTQSAGKSAEKLPEAKGDVVKVKLKPNPRQQYISFLTAAVARVHAPLAIPVLSKLALRPETNDPAGTILLRRQALWALAILGDNVRDFPKLPQLEKTAILRRLDEFAQDADPQKSAWARTALYYLDRKSASADPAGVERVDEVLARCAEVDDPFAREMVALALRFWDGKLVEPTLRKLAADDGHGQLLQLD